MNVAAVGSAKATENAKERVSLIFISATNFILNRSTHFCLGNNQAFHMGISQIFVSF